MALLSCGQTYLYEKPFYGMLLTRTRKRNFLQLGSDFILAVFTATLGTDRFVASNEANVSLSLTHRRYMKTLNGLPVASINLTSSEE